MIVLMFWIASEIAMFCIKRFSKKKGGDRKKLYVVEYAGFYNIQDGPYYGDLNVLDAEAVGSDVRALANATDIVDAYNERYNLK